MDLQFFCTLLLLCILNAGVRSQEAEEDEEEWPMPYVIPQAGIKIRLTQHFLDYASNLSTRLLAKELEGLQIPNIIQKVGMSRVNISNVVITENPPPKVSVEILPGMGLRATISQMAPRVEANYNSLMHFGFFTIEKNGSMTVRSQDVKFEVDLFIGRDEEGRPTIDVTDCQGSGLARAQFVGGWSEGLNMASVMFGKEIKSLLFAQICSRFRQDIGLNLTMALRNISMTQIIHGKLGDYEVDYALVQYPFFGKLAMESAHKGGVFYLRDGQRVTPPYEAPLIPATASHIDRMLYVYISSYTLNSAAYAVYQSDKLAINVTKDMMPNKYKEYLYTSCPGKTCVGTVFPQLGQQYPNTDVKLQIKVAAPPQVRFHHGSIRLSAAVVADLFVANQVAPHKLLTVNMNLSTEGQIAFKAGKLLFNVTQISPVTDITDSVIPELNGSGFLLNGLANVAVQQFLRPKIAEFGHKGIELPTHKHFPVTNAEILFDPSIPDVIIIAGDVHYLGKLPGLED